MPNRYSNAKRKARDDRDHTRAGKTYRSKSVLPISPAGAQMSRDELLYLYDIPSKIKPNDDRPCLIANLGCFKGHSASALARGLKDNSIPGKVYTVDIYGDSSIIGKPQVQGNREIAEDRFKKEKVTDLIVIYQHDTATASQMLSELKFDFILIDAGHDYVSCKRDFENWRPLLREGGLISFHDIHLNSVNQVIEELLGDWELVHHHKIIKTFRKGGST